MSRAMSKEEQLKQCSKILQFLLGHKDAGEASSLAKTLGPKAVQCFPITPAPVFFPRMIRSTIFGARDVEGMGTS